MSKQITELRSLNDQLSAGDSEQVYKTKYDELKQTSDSFREEITEENEFLKKKVVEAQLDCSQIKKALDQS